MTKFMRNLMFAGMMAVSVGTVGVVASCSSKEITNGPENIGKVQSALACADAGTWASCMTELAPVGLWHMDESIATTLHDSSGKGHNGQYWGDVTPEVDGKIGTAVLFSTGSSNQYAEVGDHDDFSLVKNSDDFMRTIYPMTSSWGTSPHGDTWVPMASSGNYYWMTGGVALIDESAASGSFGQVMSNSSRLNSDLQVKIWWDTSLNPTTGTLTPAMLVARMQDANNFYRAELSVGTSSNYALKIVRVKSGPPVSSTQVGPTATIPSCSVNNGYYLRFQLSGRDLKAKAWCVGTDEPQAPSAWNIETTDSSGDAILTSGKVGVRSMNSNGNSHPIVYFYKFWHQSLGMTIHAWMKPSQVDFNGNQSCLCSGAAKDDAGVCRISGTLSPIANYVSYVNKEGPNDAEWQFRFYPNDSYDTSAGCPPTDRRNRLSGYLFGTNTLGSGSFCQPGGTYPECNNDAGAAILSSVNTSTWYQIVTTYDPGDYLDKDARSHMYINGQESLSYADSAKYSNPSYSVTPRNGLAPVRIGAMNEGSWTQFQGAIDEVAIFDRALTASEIATLYSRAP